MKQLNIFKPESTLFPYRWFVLIVIVIAGCMTYYDLAGKRIFRFSNQQQWTNSGPGYHK